MATTPAVTAAATTPPPLPVLLRRVVALAAVAGYVEVTGFLDLGGIYPGIMTGNTVQLGLNAVRFDWSRLGLIGFAVALFFAGGVVASIIRRHLRQPPLELLLMAALLLLASVLRRHAGAHVPLELPVLAFAMAMQGETIASFGGISLQTIVVTNNMVKFSDMLVGRYLPARGADGTVAKPVALREVLLPGCAWLSYSVAAGLGALGAAWLGWPLLVPAVVLVLVVLDLLSAGA